jgi:hypothetical protein
MGPVRDLCTVLFTLSIVATTARSARADEVVLKAQAQGSTAPSTPAGSASATGIAAAPQPTSEPPPPERRDHSIWPTLLIASGVAELGAGIIMAVTAPKLPSGCDSDTDKCTRRPGETEAQLSDRQDRAGEHEALETGGYILVGVGLASITGGIIWCLVEEKKASESAKAPGWMRVAPWAASGGGGLVTSGTF